MRITEFRVRTFRNVLDSGAVAVEPDITCLVGKNESGKTALLQALLRTKPPVAQRLDPEEHYPRWLLTRDRANGTVEDAAPIEVRFSLDDEDRAAVEALVGPDVLRSSTFRFGVRYGGSYAGVDLDGAQAVRNVLDRAEVSESTREGLSAAQTPEQLKELVATRRSELSPRDLPSKNDDAAELDAVTSQVTAMLGDAPALGQAVVSLLDDRMPTFVYFDDYAMLPGRVDLDLLAETEEPGSVHLDAVRALLHLAGADAEALLGDAYELRRAELEAVSNDLTQQVFEYWTQDQELAVEIDVDTQPVARGAARTVMTRYLDIRVRDRRRGFTTNFGQRSAGFQWFFSFLAVASGFDRFPNGVVVLLDEPALTLHPAGQADLLRFIEDRIAPTAQVIYTTHSPFMVNPDHPQRLRMVEDRGPQEGAVVLSDPADSQAETLRPLQTVLGLDLARGLFGSGASGPGLFDQEATLVVRAPSDLVYLTVLSDHLARRGRAHLDGRWRVLPAGGAAGLPVMLALLGQGPGVTALVEGPFVEGPLGEPRTQPGAGWSGGMADRNLVFLSDLTFTASAGIEDLFTDADYLRLHNGAFGTRLRPAEIDGDGSILSRVASVTGPETFDRERPAEFLLRQRRRMLRKLSKDTINRFETLFETVNATLR